MTEPYPDCPEKSFCGAISSRLRKFTQSARNRPAEAFFLDNQGKAPSILAHSECAKIGGALPWLQENFRKSGQSEVNFGPLRVVQNWRSIALIVQQKLTKRAIPCPDCPKYAIFKKYLRDFLKCGTSMWARAQQRGKHQKATE